MKYSKRKVEVLAKEYVALQKRHIEILKEKTDACIERDHWKDEAKMWKRISSIYLFCHLLWVATRYGIDLIFK